MSSCGSSSNNIRISNVVVSSEYWAPIQKLLQKYNDSFMATDKDLGRTYTVKMRIDTCSYCPLEKNLYSITLNLLDPVDKVIDGMLDSKVIEKSRRH